MGYVLSTNRSTVLVRDRWFKSVEQKIPMKRAKVQSSEREQGQRAVPTQTQGQGGSGNREEVKCQPPSTEGPRKASARWEARDLSSSQKETTETVKVRRAEKCF